MDTRLKKHLSHAQRRELRSILAAVPHLSHRRASELVDEATDFSASPKMVENHRRIMRRMAEPVQPAVLIGVAF